MGEIGIGIEYAAYWGEVGANLIMPWDSALYMVRTQLIVMIYYYFLLFSLYWLSEIEEREKESDEDKLQVLCNFA